MGYSKTGSSVSRLRTRTSIAANSVPTAANPIVPATSSADQHDRIGEDRRAEQQSDERHQDDLDEAEQQQEPERACRRRARDDRPARAATRAACRCSARARTSAPSRACRRTRSPPTESPAATSSGARPSTHDRERKHQDHRDREEQRRRAGSRGCGLRRSCPCGRRARRRGKTRSCLDRPPVAIAQAAALGVGADHAAVLQIDRAAQEALGDVEIVRRQNDQAAGAAAAPAAGRPAPPSRPDRGR